MRPQPGFHTQPNLLIPGTLTTRARHPVLLPRTYSARVAPSVRGTFSRMSYTPAHDEQHAEMVAEFAATADPVHRHLLAVAYRRRDYAPHDVLDAMGGAVPAEGALPTTALFGLAAEDRARVLANLSAPPPPEQPAQPRVRVASILSALRAR